MYSEKQTTRTWRPNLTRNTVIGSCKAVYFDELNKKLMCNVQSTNIPVQGKLEIPGGSSPFLGPPNASSENTEDSKGVHYVPSAPQTPPSLPGQVLLDYVPPHPPMSNPRKLHRYVLALLESNKGPGSLLDLKENGNAQKADDVLQSKTRWEVYATLCFNNVA